MWAVGVSDPKSRSSIPYSTNSPALSSGVGTSPCFSRLAACCEVVTPASRSSRNQLLPLRRRQSEIEKSPSYLIVVDAVAVGFGTNSGLAFAMSVYTRALPIVRIALASQQL